MSTNDTAALRAALRAAGRPYPAELRRRAAQLSRDLRASGTSQTRVAAALGVSITSLRNWEGEYPSFAEVSLISEPAATTGLRVVHDRTGLRVEGLDLEGVIRLLTALP